MDMDKLAVHRRDPEVNESIGKAPSLMSVEEFLVHMNGLTESSYRRTTPAEMQTIIADPGTEGGDRWGGAQGLVACADLANSAHEHHTGSRWAYDARLSGAADAPIDLLDLPADTQRLFDNLKSGATPIITPGKEAAMIARGTVATSRAALDGLPPVRAGDVERVDYLIQEGKV